MKTVKSLLLVATLSSLAFSAIAHEHGMKKETKGETYDCEAVNKMDHSKMDMNDPKIQDMMKQCGGHNDMHNDNHGGQHHNQDQQHGNSHGNHGNSEHHK